MGTISDKRNKKNGTTEKKDNSPKGFSEYGKNLGKMLFHLFIWSIVSFGFIVSIKETRFTQFSIPSFLKDFSNELNKKKPQDSGNFISSIITMIMNMIQDIFGGSSQEKHNYSPFQKWLSTIYNKTYQTENNILNRLNDAIQMIFGLSYIRVNKQSSGGHAAFSVISALLLFILAPFLAFGYSAITWAVSFFTPMIQAFENRELLKFESFISFIFVLFSLWFFFFSGLFVVSPIYSFVIICMLFFMPYILAGLDLLRKSLTYMMNMSSGKEKEGLQDAISAITYIIGQDNIDYFGTYAAPVFKKVIPFLINFLLIYAAATTTTYGLPEGVSIGMWIGLAIFNIGAIMMVFKSL
jgi:hypothetical protein